MPVCARCTGIYFGAALAAIAGVLVRERAPSIVSAGRWRALLAAAALPVLLSLLYEWSTGHMPSHWVRAATGAPLGAMVAWMVVWVTAPRRRAEDQVN